MSTSQLLQPQRKVWTTEEDHLLQELRQNKELDWIEVARRIGGRNPSQCAQRWKRIKGYKLRRQWTQDEDQKLKSLVKEYGYHWSRISKLMSARSGKQIREHYLNQLHPDLNNEPWSLEEDEMIIKIYGKVGGKWSIIQKQLSGRSENSIKNRFYSYLRSKHLNIKNPYYIIPEQEKQSITQEKNNEKINQLTEQQLSNMPTQVQMTPSQQYVMSYPLFTIPQISSVNYLSQYQMVYNLLNYSMPQCYMPFLQSAIPYL